MLIASDAPVWIAAAAAIGSLAATVVLFVLTRRFAKGVEVRQQASQVYAWAEPAKAGDKTRVIKLANVSSEPVYRVNAYVYPDARDKGGPNSFRRTVLPPGAIVRSFPRTDPEDPGPSETPTVELAF